MFVADRHNLPPQPVTPDFAFQHRLTPQMREIVSKRKAKTDKAKAADDTAFLEPIHYCEIVEIQLTALISKEHRTKLICRY
jgi:hypothetical protein